MSADRVTNVSLFSAVVTTAGEMLGWVEAHTALIGILISAFVALATIIYRRQDIVQRARTNDIAEKRLDFDRQKYTDSKGEQ